MAAEIHIRDAATWKKATEVHIRDAGAWKECLEVWIRDAGAWVQTYLKELLTWSGAAKSNTTFGVGENCEQNGFRMNADGTCSICNNVGVYGATTPRWCNVTPANISAYEMKWTKTGVALNTKPASEGTFQNMAAFTWEYDPVSASRTTTITITLRKDGDAASEQVGTVTLTQEYEP